MPISKIKPTPAPDSSVKPPTAESLGWQLRAALPPLRLHSLSLYDQAGEVLWLSEGALGPDEHAFVLDALGALGADPAGQHREYDLGEGRGAVLLAVRSPQMELVGLAMILVDMKALSGGGLASRILTPPVRALLQRLAILLGPASRATAVRATPSAAPAGAPGAAAAPALAAAPAPAAALAPAARLAPAEEPAAAAPLPQAAAHATTTTGRALDILEWSPPEPIERSPPGLTVPPAESSGDTAETTEEVLAPRVVHEILTFDLSDDVPPLGADRDEAPRSRSIAASSAHPATSAPHPAVSSAHPAVSSAHGPSLRSAARALLVRELVRLRPGGRMRRFQLSLESAAPETQSGSAGDFVERTIAGAVRSLAEWFRAHPALEDGTALNFSIAIPAVALERDDLPEAITECVHAAHLSPACLGFEIPECVGVREPERTERFAHALERLGCSLLLDDFAFDSGAIELLRSRALRLVKVDRGLIRAVLRDKLAQARIVAISQAARVLGIHCAAKQVDALATQRWLAATGFDFAEGTLFGGPRPLERLAAELTADN